MFKVQKLLRSIKFTVKLYDKSALNEFNAILFNPNSALFAVSISI